MFLVDRESASDQLKCDIWVSLASLGQPVTSEWLQ